MSSVSPLDNFATNMDIADAHKMRAYRLATFRLLASDYIAFGMPEVIDAVLFLVKLWLCWICVQSFDDFLGLREEFDKPSISMLGNVVLSCVGMPLWAGVGALL